MSKAFTKGSDAECDEHDHAAEEAAHARFVGVKDYITPSGLQRLNDERRFLLTRERPAMTQEVVDPESPRGGRAATQVFFGATMRHANAAGTERVVKVVGADEVDLDRNRISWMSRLARALMKSGPGDCVVLHAPGTTEQLQILEVLL